MHANVKLGETSSSKTCSPVLTGSEMRLGKPVSPSGARCPRRDHHSRGWICGGTVETLAV
jgi:hypothetical protein